MKDKDKLQHIPLKPDPMPERVWVELGDSSETSRVWPFSPATSNKAVPYVPAKLVSELEAENKELRATIRLVLDTHERLGPDQSSELRRPEIISRLRAALSPEAKEGKGE